MKILIDDGMQIKVGTGIGKYTKYLYEYLNITKKKDDVIDLIQFDKKTTSKKFGRLKYLIYINSKKYKRICANYDIVHFTNYAMPVFKSKNVKYAVTIHDLASFLHPETFSKLYGLYSKFTIRWAIKHADILFTVSESVKKEIIEKWPYVACKVHVAYPGLYEEFNQPIISGDYNNSLLKGLADKKFFLFVGTIEKRKNVSLIFRAFEKVKDELSDCEFKLVFAGRPGFGYEEFVVSIENSKYKDDVIFTGFTSADDVKRLYQRAAAYVFPTVYEGFGSIQLECMCNHLPLILSDIPTNREVSGEYGLFFDLKDIDELIDNMKKIVTNDFNEQQLKSISEERLSRFRWNNTIKSFWEGYNS